MKNHKQNILNLKDGETYFISTGEEAGGEIWYKNDVYFLFEVPQYGGEPRYISHYSKFRIDDLINVVLGWT